MTIQEHILLSEHTTFRIGGPARYFTVASTTDELKKALAWAEEKKQKIFILGGGSNLLMSDAGFDGLVIKIGAIDALAEGQEQDGTLFISSEAGKNWDDFVAETIKLGYGGLENLSGIPGTVGAAPVQNIGAYGSELKDFLGWVEAYDPETEQFVRLNREQCRFGYRDSIFKHEAKHLIITWVAFYLPKTTIAQNISYKDLAKTFQDRTEKPTTQEVRDAVLAIRKAKLPDVKEVGTAGSFFKNPIILKSHFEELVKKYPGMVSFSVDDEHVKVSAAWILDNVCGFKGVRRGNVGVYQNQALVLVNWGGGTSAEVQALAQDIIASVKEKTNIDLVPEVEILK